MKKNKKLKSEGIEKTQVNNTSVYFFTLLIQAVDKLLELLGAGAHKLLSAYYVHAFSVVFYRRIF